MKLYNGVSPNGARVAILIAEKGLDIPTHQLDLMAGETRADAFRAINSLGQVPVLELDDGRYLAESIAICRYLEHLHTEPSLFGSTPEEQAFIEMWIRRMELRLFNTLGDVALHEFEFFKDQIQQNADYARAQRLEFIKRLSWLDQELSDGRSFVAGDAFSMADIIGMTMLIIAGYLQLELPANLTKVKKWEARVVSRPSFPALPQAA